jgi:hypothetical protein
MTDQSGEFVQRTEPFRRELLAHCYRMLGSADDAADLVQETYLRAWRAYGTFEGRSSRAARPAGVAVRPGPAGQVRPPDHPPGTPSTDPALTTEPRTLRLSSEWLSRRGQRDCRGYVPARGKPGKAGSVAVPEPTTPDVT